MSTPNDNQAAEALGYAEAKEQFETQGGFSSGRTYESEELSEAYDRGVNRAETEQALAEEKANQEQIGATVQAARASATQPQSPQGDDEQLAYLDSVIAERNALLEQRDALQAQRDELLAVMEKQVKYTEQLARMVNHFSVKLGLGRKVTAGDFIEAARAAIASATEGEKANES